MKISPLIKEKIKNEILKFIEKNRGKNYVRIPSERNLAEKYNVSRTTIRSVIKELINNGVIVQFQGKGTYIVPKLKEKDIHIIYSPDIKKNDPFYTKFFLELSSLSSKEDINIIFANIDNLHKKDIPLIIVGLINEDLMRKIKEFYNVIITIEQYLAHDEIIQVSIDDYKIGWIAGEILINYGFRNLIHLAGPEKYTAPYLRKLGFIDRLKKETKIYYEILEGKMNWNSGYELGEVILQRFNNIKNPLGIFTANDWMAIGLIQRLREKRIKIGEEISIIGCDNIPLASEVVPSLTTFDWNVKSIILEIIHIINSIYSGKTLQSKRILIPAKLILRETLKKV
ncbi:MAG: LacI family transcriptional regulator [Dictyoglomus sp.]|nr:LacI family transcriptional regulator [Dictyoglomus sp.]MCX7942873.1 LacI family transcriptional regulator [Dictyoglomaceae bacterium]MDW8188008.1 LacI family DNA-binding transcriptional regulator [Dictyoglomus sp.]